MEKLDRLAAECRFVEMANDLRSLSGDPAGAKRASLLALAEAAAIFLMDLEGDLAGDSATLNLALKSGETAQRVALKESGRQLVAEVAGQVREANWADFTSDALIELHQSFVLQSVPGIERMRRHECAIAYSWLSGNRERARTAALALAEENASFKQRWESIAAGVPR
jgi:hypothetical protein